MNTYDPQKAQRVWQRVHSQSEEPSRVGNLQELIMNEREAAATYLRLAKKASPREASVLQRLFREKQSHALCLKGLYTLITGLAPTTRAPQPASEPMEVTLRKCYGQEMRSLKEYEARSDDPEYGAVFKRLAEQEREHCRAVLELIGSIGKRGG